MTDQVQGDDGIPVAAEMLGYLMVTSRMLAEPVDDADYTSNILPKRPRSCEPNPAVGTGYDKFLAGHSAAGVHGSRAFDFFRVPHGEIHERNRKQKHTLKRELQQERIRRVARRRLGATV
jgi:hypothetical protein